MPEAIPAIKPKAAATTSRVVALLDYDDNLAETEIVALTSACNLANEILRENGSSRQLDVPTFIETHPGKTFRQILRDELAVDGISLSTQDEDRFVTLELERACEAFAQHLEPTRGANKALAELGRQEGVELAVVSSSSLTRLLVCLGTTGQAEYFDPNAIFSAQTHLSPPVSKPKPDIYLHAMERLKADPEICLAVEDSPSGVKSAVAAKITVVGFIGALKEELQSARAELLFATGARWVIEDHRHLPQIFRLFAAGNYAEIDKLHGAATFGVAQ